jgi:hypothetical protein
MRSDSAFLTIEEEKRRQKADLLLAHQESEESLTSLCEDACATVTDLREVIALVEGAKPKSTTCGVPEVEQRLAAQHSLRHERIITDGRYRKAMNLDAVLDLVTRLEDAKRERDSLRERKSALGLR